MLSAYTGQGCDALLLAAGRMLTGDAKEHVLTIDARDGQRLAWLYAHGEVISDVEAISGGHLSSGHLRSGQGPCRKLRVRLTPREAGRFAQLEPGLPAQ